MKSWKSHLALFLANFLYGINYVIAKGIMPDFISPEALVFLRIIPTTILFWIIGIWCYEPIKNKKDFATLLYAAFFGVFLNQYLFIAGLNKSAPIDASIIMTTNPILVLLAAALMLGEKISAIRLGGIILGAIGALLIVAGKGFVGFEHQHLNGDLLILANSVSFAIYMVFARPLMQNYNAVTVLKWIFLFGSILYFPFGFQEFTTIHWHSMSPRIILAILFIVLATTFLTYLLINYALIRLKSTTVSIYIYVQPVIAAVTAILIGMDRLTWLNITASILVFSGVYMVSVVNAKK
jgi:drug/metabolite transporter (DMT)-like permease